MSNKKYRMELTGEEREELRELTTKGRASARKQVRARMLLQCDEDREDGGRTDGEIATALEVSESTVMRVRQRCGGEFEPVEARRIAERLEIHYTPKHGSWLNMAEIEIGQCLDRRLPDCKTIRKEVDAWQKRRNSESMWVDWRFTTADARIELQSPYPSIQKC